MDKAFHEQYRLPFVARDKVNDGGTASVFQVLIQKDFVNKNLQEHLGKPLRDSNFGEVSKTGSIYLWILSDGLQCYEMAVKSYSIHQKNVYEREKLAFMGLSDKPGMVRYFGCYEHRGKDREETKFNILLEFGKSDLAEYFCDKIPPQLPSEIFGFWKDICMVATSIRTCHQLPHGKALYNG
jgi:hypothetical protein